MLRVLVLACLFGACRSASSVSPSSPERDALLAADREFCARTAERGVEGWLTAFDEHGSQVGDDFAPITGHAAIRAHMEAFFADPANSLEWTPDDARVSEAGNLGSTTGRWRVLYREADGTVRVVASGRYFDVWRKHEDGTWKLLYDVGDTDLDATGSGVH
ncbi:MAG: nuclear transport factor 2 family protein [Planctomycetes bacterium]|nr:nuclear transport factor 2 family protein [Planctomycetota bacterium]